MQKRILFLGGSYYQLAPIQYAKQRGHYVITCDYLPDNPGHKLADEYYNVSTTDLDGVYQLAKKCKVDGIVAFASDPSAPAAAYAANKLGLPGNPFESVVLLTRKDLFRKFLTKHNFHAPRYDSFISLNKARSFFSTLNGPAMVKPVDSSGSKGVTMVASVSELGKAFEYALKFSNSKKVLIEEFIYKKGFQIAGDGFVYDGKLVFRCFAQEHFNKVGNPFVPIGESFPLQVEEVIQNKIHSEIQRLLALLNMEVGAINFDIMLDKEDNVYLIEIGPRSGGNLISEVIHHSTGIDLAKYVVDAALGLNCSGLGMYKAAANCSCYMLHSKKSGIYEEIQYDDSISGNIIKSEIFIDKGTKVHSFEGANLALGCLLLKFENHQEMIEKMESMDQRLQIKLA